MLSFSSALTAACWAWSLAFAEPPDALKVLQASVWCCKLAGELD